MRLGFIGTGNMGNPMAGHLLAAGHEVVVRDLRKEAAENLLAAGARWAGTPAEVAASAEVVFVSLPTPTLVEQVVCDDGLLQALAPGSCLVDLTTNDPVVVRRIGAALEACGLAMLEAPVTGGVPAAKAGTLTTMVGGDRTVFERYRPLLERFSEKVFHLGDLGAANVAKLITNLLSFANFVAATEGMILGKKAGLDLRTLWQVITASVGTSFAVEHHFPRYVFDGSFTPLFPVDMMARNLATLTRLGRELDVPLPIANLVEQNLVAARALGLGSASNKIVATFLEQLAGVELRIPET